MAWMPGNQNGPWSYPIDYGAVNEQGCMHEYQWDVSLDAELPSLHVT